MNSKLVNQSHLPSATPTLRQLEYQDWETGIFFHFGIRSFYEGCLDHVVIQEDLSQGEAVRRFAVHIQTGISGRMVTIYEGRNIGHKAICRFPLVACSKVVLEITEADRPARLCSVTLHNTTGLTHQH